MKSSFQFTNHAISGDSLSKRRSLEAKLEAQRNSSMLNLKDCCIGDEGCHVLVTFMQKYTAITDIDLDGNSIGSEGLTALAQIIATSSTLRSLSLEWNKIGGSSDQGMKRFFGALGENRSLLKLNLKNNEIGPEIGEFVAHCL
jgi:NLR family CARD domain-containing protein 3